MTAGSRNAPIVLIGSLSPEEEHSWLDALRLAMPDECVLPVAEIREPGTVELAIVANPDPAVVARFGSLKWLQSLWAGVERLVAEPSFNHLPLVRMVDPELARTMSEAVLAWTLYLHREMPAYLAQQRERQWRQLPYVRPSERRIGVLGLGVLGRAAARTLHAAGFTVRGWSRTERRLAGSGSEDIAAHHGPGGLESIVRGSDILVCLLPLTTETRHLIDRKLLDRMPARACLINFGRGALVRTPDLIDALDGGRLSHAVLDVFETEPLPPESPLWLHPRITALPHISAGTDTQTASRIVADNIRRWRVTGELPETVDRRRGY